MPILIIFASKAFDMIIARLNRAFLGSFIFVCEHVCFQIFEHLAAIWEGTTAFLLALFATEVSFAPDKARL